MADGTAIEWTHRACTKGETWNPIAGCDIVSPGCKVCYAMRQARRIELMEAAQGRATHYLGTTKVVKGKPVWTGRIALAGEKTWQKPLRWKFPRTIFVNSMSDLFHPGVPIEAIDRVLATAALTPQHTFIILTKRADRMLAYMSEWWSHRRVYEQVCDMVVSDQMPIILLAQGIADPGLKPEWPRVHLDRWPLPNVWLGVSAERQQEADERIPDLLATPAAVRFVSAEPLLGQIDFHSSKGGTLWIGGQRGCEGNHKHNGRAGDEIHGVLHDTDPRQLHHHHDDRCRRGLDWVIVGGESGDGARPMHPDWARGLRDQCAAAGVPFFFKQWGAWATVYDRDREDPDWRRCDTVARETPDGQWLNLAGGQGFHGEQVVRVKPVAKRIAGRLLDGIEHNAFPQVSL